MNITKKITAFSMAALISLGLVSCGNKYTDDYSKGLDENGFFKGVKASDIVKLPEYKGIEVDKDVPVANDEEIKEQVDSLIEQYGESEKIMDVTIKDGDTVNIDYVGYVNGKAFEGGDTKGEGTEVTIGVTNYIEGFLDQLIGHKPGDSFDINVTFPENYHNSSLSGKKAVFKTTVNYVCGDKIDTEITDAIAKKVGFEDADELMADLKAWIVDNDSYNVFSELIGKATCDKIPDSVLDYVINYNMSETSIYVEATYGYTLGQYIVALGYSTIDQFVNSNMATFEAEAVRRLAAQAIAELEGITVTAEDIEAAGYDEEDMKDGNEAYIKHLVLLQNVLPKFVVDNATLIEADTKDAE